MSAPRPSLERDPGARRVPQVPPTSHSPLPASSGADVERGAARRDLARLLRLFAPHWRWMGAGAAIALVALLANIGLLATSGEFIALMALAGASGAVLNYFTPAAMIRAFALLRTGGRYVERLLTHDATFRLLTGLRVWFYERIEPLAPAVLQQVHAADLLSRIQADIDTLNKVYLRLFVPLAVGAAACLLVLGVMAWYSVPVAASTALLLVLAGVLLPAWVHLRGRTPGREALHLGARMRVDVADSLAGSAELRVYGAERRWQAAVHKLSVDWLARQKILSDLSGLSSAAVGLLANLAMWLAVLWILPEVARGRMAPAHLAMLALFAMAAFEAVAPLPQAFHALGEMLAAARRIFSMAEATPAIAPAATRASAHAGALPRDGAIRLSGLRFRYAEHMPWVLDGVDLEIPAGGRVALVGVSGAGKTSVVQILARFWEYQDGRIMLGGGDLRDYAPDAVRASLAIVSQDAYMFQGTVLDNLLLAKPDASEAEVVAACQAAQIHDFIVSLPQGYASEVGEAGLRLSTGQARRIAIARAVLKDAPILILDEPTEGLDVGTEHALFDALKRLMRDRTVLLITHRLGALASLVDEVAVLDGGRIVQRGHPEQLRAQPGPYADMLDAIAD